MAATIINSNIDFRREAGPMDITAHRSIRRHWPESAKTTWQPPQFVPAHVGEYEASRAMLALIFRWWDGKCWGQPYKYFHSQGIITVRKSKPALCQDRIFWRGLRCDPATPPTRKGDI